MGFLSFVNHTQTMATGHLSLLKSTREIYVFLLFYVSKMFWFFFLFVEKGKPEVDYVTQVYEYSKCRSIIIQISIFALYIYEI